MTKKELVDLLDKFNNGECTHAELKKLHDLYDSFQKNNHLESWSDEDIENSRLKLLLRINKTIAGNLNKKTARQRFYKIAMTAAIVTGLIFGGLFYKMNIESIPHTEYKDAITLELEDGSLKILDESSHFLIKNNSGKEIGQQMDSVLIYHPNPKINELTYNTLKVPYGKTFNLQLSDGTKIKLNSGSSLKYPVAFIKGKDRLVYVTGEAYLDVAKDKNHPFIVNTNAINIRVLGTQFNVHAYPEDTISEIVLVEGSIGFYQQGERFLNTPSNLLAPNYKGSFNKITKKITKSPVVTDIYTSWMEGELVFRDMNFENILKKLERHFNVKIINQNKTLSAEKFQASFGKKPDINEVLKELKIIYNIDYNVNGNTITIK